MKINSLIDSSDVIKKILKHLGLWLQKWPLLPRAHAPPEAVHIDYLNSQIASADDYLIDLDRSTLRLSTGYPIDS